MNVDSTEITALSLCAGYGGIDLGLKRVLPTCRTVAFVEIEAFACANLVAKMEAGELDAAPIWTDLKSFDGGAFRERVDILTGGFPCQPFSAAGNRNADDDPRHLFPYILEAVRTVQPGWVFLENVEGLVSAKLKGDGWNDPAGIPVLLHVIRELERAGYRATWGIFSAAEVGATHQRRRVFILAHASGPRSAPRIPEPPQREKGIAKITNDCGDRNWPARPGEPQHEWEAPRTTVADCDQSTGGDGGELDDSVRGRHRTPDEEVRARGDGAIDAGWQAEPGLGRAAHGPASRVDRLRLLGNGVVPAVAAKAFATLYQQLIAEARP